MQKNPISLSKKSPISQQKKVTWCWPRWF